jgi:hypothetical protein
VAPAQHAAKSLPYLVYAYAIISHPQIAIALTDAAMQCWNIEVSNYQYINGQL